jgi:hypothetical protein
MNEQTRVWQTDARRAFDWIGQLYDQSKILMDDAEGIFEDAGWSTKIGNGMGGVALTTVLDEWPFVYLKVFGAMPPGAPSTAPKGEAALFGILFHDGLRAGPVCVGAKVEWSDARAQCDHWMMYAALGGDGPSKSAFDRSKGPVSVASPGKRARDQWPGVERVTWFEVPLGAINSPQTLKDVVQATQRLLDGDDGPARKVIAGLE